MKGGGINTYIHIIVSFVTMDFLVLLFHTHSHTLQYLNSTNNIILENSGVEKIKIKKRKANITYAALEIKIL